MGKTDWGLDDISESQAQKAVTANEADEGVFTAVAGRSTKSVAGSSDITLTTAEALNMIQEYTGVLTGNINVIVPAYSKLYAVYNNTTGAFTLTVKTASGSGVAVTQTKKTILVCDGTNVVAWSTEV
jgi:hypothetical protein